MRYRKFRKYRSAALAWILLMSIMMTLCACGSGQKRVAKETEETTFGIDVAKYQATIDWPAVENAGIDFAMIRVGYRSNTDGSIVADSNGRYNLQEASRAGIPIGVYFFSTAVSEEEAREEAAWVAEFISQYPITYPVAYDCENFRNADSRQFMLTKEERTDYALAFLETIEDLGYEGMFYASKNDMYLDANWEVGRIQKHYKIWVAQYPDPPYPQTPASSYAGEHQMWQYSMNGSVPGIDQSVDLDVAYFGYDGIEPAKNPEPPEEASPDPEVLMNFREVSETVTAKDATRLRSIPSQGEDSMVLFTLENGQTAQRIALSDSGWSKVIYQDTVCYAVSSYLTTDLFYTPGGADDGIDTEFSPVDEQVTAKVEVNLRKLPSVEREDAVVLFQLKNGQLARRTGISDNGWSRLVYQGTTCYAVSSYLTQTGEAAPAQTEASNEIQTEFEPVQERVTAKEAVNLRTMPSTEHPNVKVVHQLKNGEIALRTGINQELGWSRVEYEGQVLYCVSSYLKKAE